MWLQGLKSWIVHNFSFCRTTPERQKKKKKKEMRGKGMLYHRQFISFVNTEFV